MKNILVPTDFSNEAYNALFYATQMLASKACTFHILNSYTETTPLRSRRIAKREGKALIRQLSDESMEGLRSTCHRIKLDTNTTHHQFHIISRNSGLLDAISTVVRENQIDLVVMGNRGHTGAKTIFWGSNTARAIKHMRQCPILTIPREIEFKEPKQIAFATDYKRNYSADILEPLRFTASLFNSSVHVMHITEEKKLDKYQESNSHVLREYLSPYKYAEHWMPYFGSKADAIDLFLKELGMDMLTMVNYNHDFLENLLREPVIKRVNFRLGIPFLVIPCAD